MSFYQILALLTIMFVGTITPGPAMLYAMNCGMQYNKMQNIVSAFGISLMALMYGFLALVGLASILMKLGIIYTLLKIMGGLYLITCAYSRITAPYVNLESTDSEKTKVEHRYAHIFKSAVLLGASNPKGILFFAALFPQFIPQNTGTDSFLPILAITFLTSMAGLLLYAIFGRLMSKAFKRKNVQKGFNIFSAAFYSWFGFRLILEN